MSAEGEYMGQPCEAEEMVTASGTYYESSKRVENGSRHTKFLDLTNGEGGERALAPGVGGEEYGEADASGGNSSRAAARSSSQDEVDALVDAHIRQNTQMGSIRVDPNTPGKVVEAGQEHTGRWTKEEHEAFLSALQMYGKEWKKVAAKVKTRTVVQTRTHAQKYFQKLQKAMESGGTKEDVANVEMGTAPEAKKASAVKKKRNTPSIAAKARRPNLSASQLLTNLTTAAQSIQTPTSDSQARLNNTAFGGGAIGLSGAAAAILSRTQQQNSFRPSHGFSTGSTYTSGFGSVSERAAWGASSAMKITAPDPDASIKSGSFPEPSPAACGKRKLAEIAAARMLAGVAAGGKPLLSSAVGGDPDGDVTPPPQRSPRAEDAPGLTLSNVPAPPLIGVGVALARKATSLQIVNPESLGVDYDETQKRRRADGDGEETPWEGQLEALVSKRVEEQAVAEEGKPEEEKKQAPMVMVPQGGTHPVCGPGSSHSRSRLHRAVCDLDIEGLQRELGTGDTGLLAQKDDMGYCPLHSACALGLLRLERPDVPCEIVRQLIGAGADPSAEDENGNTPLHWSARAGEKVVSELLLRKNSPKDAKNHSGETPLHWAMRAGRTGMEVVGVLLENGARPSSLNKMFKRPVDVAADGYEDDPSSAAPKRQLEKPLEKRKRVTKEEKRILRDATEERKEVRENLLKLSAQSRTLVLHHPECLEHTPKSSTDWEAPDRITAIMGRVALPDADISGKSMLMPYEVTISSEFERAKLDLLSRVHSTDYLSFVNDLSKELERQQKEEEEAAGEESSDHPKSGTLTPPVVPFTPMVQRSMIKIEESRVKLGSHSDTSFSVGSLKAARRAAGSVQHAVDCVLVGRNRNAMCVVRPPGHHAGVNGLLDGGESCGFCIFNNVAAGALHAISDERLLCERCAIVDIDVHHGNGTEEIVKKCHDPGKLFFFSIHLYDNEKKKQSKNNAFQYKFYPGTGAEDDVAFNIINVAITPLWKEVNQDKPVNTHNTRQKTRQKVSQSDFMDDSSDLGTPKDSKDPGRFSDADSDTGSASKGHAKSPTIAPTSIPSSSSATAGRFAYRQAIQNRLLPALRAFNPDLILISAGFDAARLDVGNARHERGGERMGLDLEPEDYAWTTRKVLEVADICCQGRVVSVLEGGYGRSTPGNTLELDRSNLAECAIRHLHAMVDPYDCEGRFPS